MTEKRLILVINSIYDEYGFQGVIDEVKDRLEYGTVRKINGLYRISTGGWSDDELLVECLSHMLCKFSKHFCGYIRGGAFYFCEEKYANVEMVKVEE